MTPADSAEDDGVVVQGELEIDAEVVEAAVEVFTKTTAAPAITAITITTTAIRANPRIPSLDFRFRLVISWTLSGHCLRVTRKSDT